MRIVPYKENFKKMLYEMALKAGNNADSQKYMYWRAQLLAVVSNSIMNDP